MEQGSRVERLIGLAANVLQIVQFIGAVLWTGLSVAIGLDIAPVDTADVVATLGELDSAARFLLLLWVEATLAYGFAYCMRILALLGLKGRIDQLAFLLAIFVVTATSGWVSSFTVQVYATDLGEFGSISPIKYWVAGGVVAVLNGFAAWMGLHLFGQEHSGGVSNAFAAFVGVAQTGGVGVMLALAAERLQVWFVEPPF